MIRQILAIFLAFVIFVADAEPLRLRRQATTSMAIPCPVQCSWSFSQAWTKAISFETPTANMIDDQLIDTNNGTIGVMCSLYSAYQHCLRACVASNNDYADVVKASPSYDQVCGNRRDEFDTYLPCLSNNTKTYKRVCQKVNENLLASSVRLTTQGKFDSDVAKQFCRSANDQAFCIFPVLRQTCGDGPYTALRSIVNASLTSIRISISDDVIRRLYPDCGEYFETIQNGIVMPNKTSRFDTTIVPNTTVSVNTTTHKSSTTSAYDDQTTTESISIRRDDADQAIYGNSTNGRFGNPRIRTTTESSASETVIYSRHVIIFLILCDFFFFSRNVLF